MHCGNGGPDIVTKSLGQPQATGIYPCVNQAGPGKFYKDPVVVLQ